MRWADASDGQTDGAASRLRGQCIGGALIIVALVSFAKAHQLQTQYEANTSLRAYEASNSVLRALVILLSYVSFQMCLIGSAGLYNFHVGFYAFCRSL